MKTEELEEYEKSGISVCNRIIEETSTFEYYNADRMDGSTEEVFEFILKIRKRDRIVKILTTQEYNKHQMDDIVKKMNANPNTPTVTHNKNGVKIEVRKVKK
jgi:hypothetical protein